MKIEAVLEFFSIHLITHLNTKINISGLYFGKRMFPKCMYNVLYNQTFTYLVMHYANDSYLNLKTINLDVNCDVVP